jgi:hypothetical protein
MLLVAHCLQLLNPFNENMGDGNFDGDSSEIAKESLVLGKELAEDERNNIVLSSIKVVDRGQVWFINRYNLAAQAAEQVAGLPGQSQGQAMLPIMPAQ